MAKLGNCNGSFPPTIEMYMYILPDLALKTDMELISLRKIPQHSRIRSVSCYFRLNLVAVWETLQLRITIASFHTDSRKTNFLLYLTAMSPCSRVLGIFAIPFCGGKKNV